MSKRTDFIPVDGETEYDIVGVQRSGWGLVHRDPVRGDSMNFTKLMRLEEGNLVYRTITAFEAPSAVVGPDDEGAFVTPQAFPVFRLHEKRILPAFMSLLTTCPKFHQAMSERCTGTVLRRKTLAVGAFLEIPIQLPPLSGQRRIIDLMGSIDDAIEAASRQSATSNRLLEEYLESASFPQGRALGGLAAMRSGPSWKAADESPGPMPGSHPVLGITNTPRGRDLDLSVQKYVSGIPGNTMKVTPNSIIMIRTNGNRNRIGNVYRPSLGIEGFAVSAFQIIIEPTDPADAALLYWALSAPRIQRLISDAASGSTGLGNVAIGWLRQLQLPYPWGEERRRFIETCEALHDSVQATNDVTLRLRDLRSELLSVLLSGAHRIPETYDELMGAALMNTSVG
jgi:hypothetical protein